MVLNVLIYFPLSYIFNAKICQAHLLHTSRQVHFHGNKIIWQREYMQRSLLFLCRISEIIAIKILWVEKLQLDSHACYSFSYEEVQGFFPILVILQNSQHIKRLIRNIPKLCRSLNCSAYSLPPPHTFTFSIVAVGITFVHFSTECFQTLNKIGHTLAC